MKTSDDVFDLQRSEMVRDQIAARGIRDERVLEAMRHVPRHMFVPESEREAAYEDRPLPIGAAQTISQPYIVAYMTEVLQLPAEGARVLDVGTGSAYQAAVLSAVATAVYSVEIVPRLAERAQALLAELGLSNVEIAVRDGFSGWPEHAPYDGILVAAAADKVPEALLNQLRPGARLVMPVGSLHWQHLVLVTRDLNGEDWTEEELLPVSFVPMTGRARRHRSD
ncbi:MAG: protein-L-isoaspartate(D-aspartate) O-methyltransferase [Nibricoccus sp.]